MDSLCRSYEINLETKSNIHLELIFSKGSKTKPLKAINFAEIRFLSKGKVSMWSLLRGNIEFCNQDNLCLFIHSSIAVTISMCCMQGNASWIFKKKIIQIMKISDKKKQKNLQIMRAHYTFCRQWFKFLFKHQ